MINGTLLRWWGRSGEVWGEHDQWHTAEMVGEGEVWGEDDQWHTAEVVGEGEVWGEHDQWHTARWWGRGRYGKNMTLGWGKFVLFYELSIISSLNLLGVCKRGCGLLWISNSYYSLGTK